MPDENAQCGERKETDEDQGGNQQPALGRQAHAQSDTLH
jgi:hypothetical protein